MGSRMMYKIHSETLIATADISKDTLSCYFRVSNGGPECKTFVCKNNYQGLAEYYSRMMEFVSKYSMRQTLVGFESTGVYHIPFIQFFKDKPVRLVQVNTMHVKRMKDITDNTPAKTDWKDPKVIADLVETRHALHVVIPTGPMAELRSLLHARERTSEHLTAVSNQFQDVVYTLFPEFSMVFKDIRCKTAKCMLREYATPQAVLALDIDTLTSLMRKVSRGRMGEDYARSMHTAARNSLGASEGREGLALEISLLLDLIENLEQALVTYEQKMADLVMQVPQGKYLLSIKGIGTLTVAGILGEYDGFRPFTTIAEVLKYAGLNFTENSSGRRQGKRRTSKRGRGLIRKLAYYAAVNTVKEGRAFYHHYQHHLKKRMPKQKALMAIARKIIRTMFAMSKNLCFFKTEPLVQHRCAA